MSRLSEYHSLFDIRRAVWDTDEEAVTFTRSADDIALSEIHHTGARGPVDMTFAAKQRWLKAIEYFHEIGKGWTDIFYHVFVFADGEIWEGRDIRRTSQGNIGTAVTVHIPGNNPAITPAQRASLMKVLRWAGPLIRDHQGRPADTFCAGDNVRAELASLRAELENIMSSLLPEDLGTHVDAIEAESKGFLHNNQPDRAASRSVVGVVANRVDNASRERDAEAQAAIASLKSRITVIENQIESLAQATGPYPSMDEIIAEVVRRLEE